MSEVRLIVRGAEGDWSGRIHGSCADRAVAALSADPTTLQELELAVGRFEKPDPSYRFFVNLSPGLNDQPHDAGFVLIDLVARLVVVDSTYSSPGRQGTVSYHNGRCATDTWLQYHLADDWQFSSDREQWRFRAEERRKERAAKPQLDVRAVFYGRPLLDFIARNCFSAFARRDPIAAAVRAEWREAARRRLADKANVQLDQIDDSQLTDEQVAPKTWPGDERYASPFYGTLKGIHADWLLTPREDLGGVCPREIGLDRHEHLMRDLQDRCGQWSLMGQCPPGLAESSHAFQHGGFGTHELVEYYELVRELLWSCWERLTELAQAPRVADRPESLTVGDFLADELPRLEQVRDAWLDTPDPDCHFRTPRSIIQRERARLPEGVSGREAMIDPDCPCCQMMAEMSGPFFWHLDGSNMDSEFAFDIYRRTREEWEAEQRGWEEHRRQFEAEWAERERLGVTDPTPGTEGPDAVWSRSFSVGETADRPLGIRVFGVGCRLAELIVNVRGGGKREDTTPENQAFIDQLDRDFGNLRAVLDTTDPSLSEALIDPVLERLSDTLATLASARPQVAEQCWALTSELDKLLDPPPPEPIWDRDDDIPF